MLLRACKGRKTLSEPVFSHVLTETRLPKKGGPRRVVRPFLFFAVAALLIGGRHAAKHNSRGSRGDFKHEPED